MAPDVDDREGDDHRSARFPGGEGSGSVSPDRNLLLVGILTRVSPKALASFHTERGSLHLPVDGGGGGSLSREVF